MKVLFILYGKRLLKQKFIYFFFAGFFFATYAYAFLITTPEMYDMLNIDPLQIGGARFPEFMLRFYSTNVGSLFMAFITAIYINEEEHTGMLTRPLLHGRSRMDILNAKLLTLSLTSLVMVAGIFIIAYITSAIRWGGVVFSMPIFGMVAEKYILVALSLTVIEMGTILAALYARNTVITVGIVIGVTILGIFLNQAIPMVASILSVNYYPYHWVLDREYLPITGGSAWAGVVQSLAFGILFYWLCRRRILKMNCSR
jgi:ABC-type transport system involved in multi-copper enzyme maturation permease subunit